MKNVKIEFGKAIYFFVCILILTLNPLCFSGEIITGTFDSSSPLWDRIKDSGSSQSVECDAEAFDSWNDEVPYRQFEIMSPVDEEFFAIVDSKETTVDTLLALYCNPFDPDNPDNSLIAIDDDGAGYPHPELKSISLTANTSYFLVITKYSNFQALGDFSIQLGGNFKTNTEPIATLTPTPTINITPTPNATSTPTPGPTLNPTSTPMITATPEPTLNPTLTPMITATPEPTSTPDKEPPIANFIVDEIIGRVPFEVQFFDLSENMPTNWLWDFGDSNSSREQNPLHTYTEEGMFSVTLTASNEFGEDRVTMENLILVLANQPPDKAFTFKCGKGLQTGQYGLERLIMRLGENETCETRLINFAPNTPIKIETNLLPGLRSSIIVEPATGVTDENGEIEFMITAINRGIDWIAWAVADDNGKFLFSKKAYDAGTAWGMFVDVK